MRLYLLLSKVLPIPCSPRAREKFSPLPKEGMFSKEISEKLNISIHTVNRHRQNILEKLQVDNMIEAIRS